MVRKDNNEGKSLNLLKRYGGILVVLSFVIMLVIQLVLMGVINWMGSNCTCVWPYRSYRGDSVYFDGDVSDLSVCDNLSLVASSYCLRDVFVDFFEYNITDDYSYSNFYEVDSYIKSFGGDCHDSASWYKFAGEDLGFYVEYVSVVLRIDDAARIRYGHAFTVLSDDSGYCILDQEIVRCQRLEGGVLSDAS